jgi:mRNA interferase MazF
MNSVMQYLEDQRLWLKKTVLTVVDESTVWLLQQFLDWFQRKIEIQFTKKQPQLILSKSSIVYVELGMNIGSEIFKTRPCLIISPSIFNQGNTVLIAPLTWLYNDLNKKPKKTSTHQYLVINPDDTNNLHKPSIANLGQIRCISKKRIGSKIGRLEHEQMTRLNKKMQKFFGV